MFIYAQRGSKQTVIRNEHDYKNSSISLYGYNRGCNRRFCLFREFRTTEPDSFPVPFSYSYANLVRFFFTVPNCLNIAVSIPNSFRYACSHTNAFACCPDSFVNH